MLSGLLLVSVLLLYSALLLLSADLTLGLNLCLLLVYYFLLLAPLVLCSTLLLSVIPSLWVFTYLFVHYLSLVSLPYTHSLITCSAYHFRQLTSYLSPVTLYCLGIVVLPGY